MWEIILISARALVSIIGPCLIINNFTLAKIKPIEWFCFTIFATFATVTIYFFSGSEIAIAFLNILMIALFVFYKQSNFLNTLFSSVLTVLLIISANSIFALISTMLLGQPTESLRYYSIAYWFATFVTMGAAYVASRFIGKILRGLFRSPLNEVQTKNQKYFLIALTVMSAGVMVFFYINAFVLLYENMEALLIFNQLLTIFSLIFACTLCYAFFHMLLQGIELKHNQEMLKSLQAYGVSIANNYEDIRGLRHDIVNIVSGLLSFLDADNLDDAKAYFKNDVMPIYNSTLNQAEIFKQVENIAIPALKGLVALKFATAQRDGVTMRVGIEKNVESLGFNTLDLIRAFGILLDNAIEECQNGDGEVQLIMYKSDTTITALVKNDICGEPPNISLIFNEGFSTKGKGRGIGLYEVRKIVSKYKDIILQTYIKDNRLVHEINITQVSEEVK